MLRHTFITAHNQRPATTDQSVNTQHMKICSWVYFQSY